MFDIFKIVANTFGAKKFEDGGGISLNPKSLMVKGDLLKLQEYAHKIGELINDETPVPAWVISKISKVEQTAANVKHTLEAKYPDKLAEGGEIDTDGAIVGMMLLHIGKYADKMLALVDSGIEFDEWMQHELAIAGSMIDAVYHYCDYFVGKNRYAKGGSLNIDLFEHYDKQPKKVSKILNRWWKEYGEDMDYKDTEKMREELEGVGYTFDYGLDNSPYGLRPIGVKLNELEGFEEYAKGGNVGEGWKLIDSKPPKVFGVRRATYKKGDLKVTISHSDSGFGTRMGDGKSFVWENDANYSKDFGGANHINRSTKYLKKEYGIIHNPNSLKRYNPKYEEGGGVQIESYSKPETLIDNTVTLVVKKEKGGKIPSRDSLLNFVQNHLSSGYVGARLDDLGYNRALQYSDIYKVKAQLLDNLIKEDEVYSITSLNTAIKKAAGMALGKPDKEKSEEGFYEDGSVIEYESDSVIEPSEDDCFIADIGSKGYSVSVNGKHIGNYPDFDEALRYAKEWMESNKYYPNIWNVNERGTVDLLDGEGNFVQNYAKGGTLKQRKKIAKVMREFKKRILKSHGKVVRNAKQAIAIALSEAKLSKKEMGGLIDSYQLPASDVKPVGQGGIPNYNQPLDIWCLHYEQ